MNKKTISEITEGVIPILAPTIGGLIGYKTSDKDDSPFTRIGRAALGATLGYGAGLAIPYGVQKFIKRPVRNFIVPDTPINGAMLSFIPASAAGAYIGSKEADDNLPDQLSGLSMGAVAGGALPLLLTYGGIGSGFLSKYDNAFRRMGEIK